MRTFFLALGYIPLTAKKNYGIYSSGIGPKKSKQFWMRLKFLCSVRFYKIKIKNAINEIIIHI